MRRREFVTLFGGAALLWPLEARSQQGEGVRRVAILVAASANDPVWQARVGAFLQGMGHSGWTIGRNLQVDTRWAGTNVAEIRKQAADLAAHAPDVILAGGTSVLAPLMQATHTVPIVFTLVFDPVTNGYVESLARPGGNVTGFMIYEYSFSGKWLELLKEIAPSVTRVGVLRDTSQSFTTSQLAVIQALAPSLRVEVHPIDMRNAGEIERGVAAFARAPNGGLVLTGGAAGVRNRDLIIELAVRYKLPAVYFERFFAEAGGLISLGPDNVDAFRRAGGYVDRILKGEKPAEMPVQAPTKYELVVNLKTAKAIGLSLPPSILSRADAVIE